VIDALAHREHEVMVAAAGRDEVLQADLARDSPRPTVGVTVIPHTFVSKLESIAQPLALEALAADETLDFTTRRLTSVSLRGRLLGLGVFDAHLHFGLLPNQELLL